MPPRASAASAIALAARVDVGDVALDGERVGPGVGRRLHQAVLAPGQQGDLRPAPAEAHGDAAAQPARRSHDDCLHARCPLVGSVLGVVIGVSVGASVRCAQDVMTGSRSQPRTVEVRACTALSQSTSHEGKRLQDLVEGDPSLEAGQRGAEAEVQAVAEGEVVVDPAADVEAVAVGELAVVAVARGVEEQHHAALGDDPAVVLDVAGDVRGPAPARATRTAAPPRWCRGRGRGPRPPAGAGRGARPGACRSSR